VVYDFNESGGRSSLSPTSGRLEIKKTNGDPLSSAVRTKAEAFWDTIVPGSRVRNDIFGFHHDGKQDQMVPTPGVAALGLAGLLVAGRRRRA
jgi:hypothetical protein